MMRVGLLRYLSDVHALLRDEQRNRGTRAGEFLECDLEALARFRNLHSELRVRSGPRGGVYYSGLAPETDLFIYDGPQFIHLEAKDQNGSLGRAIPTEFWARALDLHLGMACNSFADSLLEHYVALVMSGNSNDQLRAACFRWGICLVEPAFIPLPILASLLPELETCLRRAGCSKDHVICATMPFNRRFPRDGDCILLPFGILRTNSAVDALMRFQRIATHEIGQHRFQFR